MDDGADGSCECPGGEGSSSAEEVGDHCKLVYSVFCGDEEKKRMGESASIYVLLGEGFEAVEVWGRCNGLVICGRLNVVSPVEVEGGSLKKKKGKLEERDGGQLEEIGG